MKILIPRQFNKRQYLLYDAKKDFVMGVGDCLTLQNCFGYIDIKNYPRSERAQDGKSNRRRGGYRSSLIQQPSSSSSARCNRMCSAWCSSGVMRISPETKFAASGDASLSTLPTAADVRGRDVFRAQPASRAEHRSACRTSLTFSLQPSSRKEFPPCVRRRSSADSSASRTR